MFKPGQIVLCYRASIEQHRCLIGHVGEIKALTTIVESILFGSDYIVYFPAFPEGKCPYCDQIHNPLLFSMKHSELKPVDDPDADKIKAVDKELEEIT